MRRTYARRKLSDRSPAPRASPIDTDARVYWDDRHRAFFGKHKRDGAWRNKFVPVSIDNEEDAAQWFACWLRGLEETGVEPLNEDVIIRVPKTLRSLADRWLAWKKEQYASDSRRLKDCKRLLDRWVLPHAIADIDLERDLDLGHCTSWVECVQRSGRAPNTVRNIVQGMRGFLVDARGKGWIKVKENPFLDPFIRKMLNGCEPLAGKNTIIHLKKAEVRRLLTRNAPEIPALRKVRNLLAVATGCRLGELAALRWEDIDLDAPVPTVTVFRQLQRITREKEPVFKEPKLKSHRILPLHPTAVVALRWWKAQGWCAYVGRAPEPADPAFPNATGEYSISRWAALLRADLIVAGVPTLFEGKHPITFHALRRTFMSLLEGEGIGRDLIGGLAGHAGKTVTDRHYIAKNIDRFNEAVKKLPLPERLAWLPR
jgi:integrase